MTRRGDAVNVAVVGAGIIGAACAYALTRAGLAVTVLEAGEPGGGTSSHGEGNILASDKTPGPELDLILASLGAWRRLGPELSDALGVDVELEAKGGLVVAETADALAVLTELARDQAQCGVEVQPVDDAGLHDFEPELAPGLPGGVFYPQDLQVQPMLATAAMLAAARSGGASVQTHTRVTGVHTSASGAVEAVQTDRGSVPADVVVNAAGPWAGEVAASLGAPVPVLPRRGFVLVTEPLPPLIRHKVYTADYVANVASSDAGLEASLVVEGTRGGTVLIGASRERVGFDAGLSVPVVERLAAQAVRLFGFLASVRLMRTYCGFRPYCPDHLPLIGADPRVPGLFHACGHEGAGIGLAPATADLVCALVTGDSPSVDPAPFAPERLVGTAIGAAGGGGDG